MAISERDKVAHLLRRFGLGAGKLEVDQYAPLGVDGALDRLVDYEKVNEGFPVSFWEFVFRTDGSVALDPYWFQLYWLMRLACTHRPLQEKMTLFWHNHFAISASKVDFGPSMNQYVDVLRSNALGNFGTILERVSKTPAMVQWLDIDSSLKGRPNENFGRELMELFTLGIGNYTEKDVREVSRAFSGWGMRFPYYELGEGMNDKQKATFAMRNEMPMVVFVDAPELHDRRVKTILGKTGQFGPEEVLAQMAHHPATARRMAAKLWSFFAYENPEPKVVDRIAKVWTESGLELKPTIRAIAGSDEFWSDRCVRTQIKSPVDYNVGMLRQLGAGQHFMETRGHGQLPNSPMPDDVANSLGEIRGRMEWQGLSLLFPPDVSGWRWGRAWATSAALGDRLRASDFVFNDYQGTGSPGHRMLKRMTEVAPKMKPEELVVWISDHLDVDLEPAQASAIGSLCKAVTPASELAKYPVCADLMRRIGKAVFSTPQYQTC